MRAHVILVGCACLAACAAPRAEPAHPHEAAERQCFNVALIQGYRDIDGDTVRLDVAGSAYDVDISGPRCHTLEWTSRAALDTAGSSWICVGETLGQGSISFRDQLTGQLTACHIDAVRLAPRD